MDPNTVAAAARAGIDLSTHSPRRLDATVLATDGADLVLAATRTVLREVTAIDPRAWPRTFTIKELARLAAEAGPAPNGESFDAWLGRLAEGRQTADRVAPSPDDDIEDPYGGPRRDHEKMVDELSHAVATLVRYAPGGAANGA